MKAKIETCWIGPLVMDDAEFSVFNHYTMDDICEIGAMNMMCIATQDDTIYEVIGTFVVGCGDSVTLDVTSVTELGSDDDGDVMGVHTTMLCGSYITLPAGAILSILTKNHDNELAEYQYTLVEKMM